MALQVGIMLIGSCLVKNPVSNCVLTIIEDVSENSKGSVIVGFHEGVSFQRPRHRLIAVASLGRLIAVASLGRLPRNRSIRGLVLLVILEPSCQIGGALLALRH
ncbi:hypothetical protein TNCV_291871 [Trichonephila clavipes]|nr:hypothetical protein TNCV_291871 [Trichonephila clavipes]